MNENNDPVAEFDQRWPREHQNITPVLSAFQRVARAQALKSKALADLDAAFRELFDAEAELEFVKSISKKN